MTGAACLCELCLSDPTPLAAISFDPSSCLLPTLLNLRLTTAPDKEFSSTSEVEFALAALACIYFVARMLTNFLRFEYLLPNFTLHLSAYAHVCACALDAGALQEAPP